jgi:hypothetical protein
MTTTRPAVTFGILSATEIELADLACEGLLAQIAVIVPLCVPKTGSGLL